MADVEPLPRIILVELVDISYLYVFIVTHLVILLVQVEEKIYIFAMLKRNKNTVRGEEGLSGSICGY